MEPLNTELQPVKRRGRPKTVMVDKKKYQKKYFQENKERLSENNKKYMEELKISNPEKYEEIKSSINIKSKDIHRKERELYKLFLEWYERGEMTLPETHKEHVNKLLCI